MLVLICLAIRRAEVLCIDFKSAGIIRIENDQPLQLTAECPSVAVRHDRI